MNVTRSIYSSLLLALAGCLWYCSPEESKTVSLQPTIQLVSGEVTDKSIILQARFNANETLIEHDMPGIEGIGQFEISTQRNFQQSIATQWFESKPTGDFIIKKQLTDLSPDTKYYYRVKALITNNNDTVFSSVNQFKTLPGKNLKRTVAFAISTGFNYEKFYGLDDQENQQSLYPPVTLSDRSMGFEAFNSVKELQPDFFIANGDVVYYDKPAKQREKWAKDLTSMRAKWHRYLDMPNNRSLCASTPVYYLKDDHDYRFNDCDTTNVKFSQPSHQLGVQVFREQLPVVDPENQQDPTYRTVVVGPLLQLWFVEGRDYRSPNLMEDGEEKSIWGIAQKEWLKQTLLESTATFKLLISPTPMIGPDDAYKKDNHTNEGGFQWEQQEFFNWLLENQFEESNFYIICGDRHWQYHSIHPNGLEEFSSGAFVNQNSRAGRLPGDPKSTDPDAKITSAYMQTEQFGGGFIYVKVEESNNIPTLSISFRDVEGQENYLAIKQAL